MFDDEIYNLPFKEFGNIDLKRLLMVSIETYRFRKDSPLKKEVKRYIKSRFFDRYEYKYMNSEGNKHIAFYSDWFFRKDHFTNFHEFIKEFSYFDYVIPVRLEKDRLNLKRFVKMLCFDLNDLYLLRSFDMTIHEKLYLIHVLGLVRLYAQKVKVYIDAMKYKYGLVYSDSCPYENMIIQEMKNKGLITATLQHGLFSKNGIHKGVEYRASVADEFLAWNEYTRDLALECNVPYEKIKVLGIPRYIKGELAEKKEKTNVFSVVLGAKILEDENKKLIYFANELSKDKNMKFFLRYHPSYGEDEYFDYIEKTNFLGVEARGESVGEMCKKSDFSLVGSGTSMVFDLIYLDQPFFEYREDWDGKEYQKRNNYFKNFENLKLGLERGLECDESTFRYYCTTREVYDTYNTHFQQAITNI